MQIESWAETYSEAKSLAVAIREVLDGYSGTAAGTKIWSCLIDSERDMYESEISVYRTIMDYFIWHEE
jgi:hypothetical protein